MVINELQSCIRAIEAEDTLYEIKHFRHRAQAIDQLDFHILDRISSLAPTPALLKLQQCAIQLKCKLEQTDLLLFAQLRQKISAGYYSPAAFNAMVSEYVGDVVNSAAPSDEPGYDDLDTFINGLLSVYPLPAPMLEREPEMIYYQKTPARIIFEMVALARPKPHDVFFDIGSGLGQATILVNLLSGIVSKGMEYEPAYCDYARRCVRSLQLQGVSFTNINAHQGDYSKGTLFFFYTPFEGRMLQHMLDILQCESQQRVIRIFTYGHCSPLVAQQPWLTCINGTGKHHYRLYEFTSAYK
ncbi:hypothetical protein HGH93_27120 [Chitinophaga polysaccharea]|uniref:hypothetical protein n=1 Tax=Chitinophaga TaxID=79328 RepID=UPI001454E8F4|nr:MULTISPECIES: hypothetical protein [Chitinophaga]NLR61797.1 hypothetical protein [Chitinophaga polysaccharea]NLU92665.1 hypothetical protein [Chitinophaga sp. Ak27]